MQSSKSWQSTDRPVLRAARTGHFPKHVVRRLQTAAAVVTTASVALLAVRTDAAPPTAITWPTDELIALTNADRTSNSLAALLVDERLMMVAQNRSDDMLARGYLAHEIPPDGHTVWNVLGGLGLGGIWGGENLHRNNLPRAQSVSYAERALMSSPDHRASILDRNVDSLGIGVAYDETAGRSIYTILFARLRLSGSVSESAPVAPARSEPVTPAGRRRIVPSRGAPRGLVDDLVQRTLRQYLGL
jgi:uncharacterized protein YkwD